MTWLYTVLFFGFGSILGSFYNVVIWRLPNAKVLTGRSYCPSCDHVLGFLDLVPIFSFIFLRGKCRFCKNPISYRYVLIELITGMLFALGYWLFAVWGVLDTFGLVWYLVVVSVALVTFVIDLEHFLILDKVTFFGLGILVLLSAYFVFFAHDFTQLYSSLLGALLGMLPFALIWFFSKGKWMGLGDVKFMLFMGYALGYPVVFVGILLAFWLGALVALPLLILGKKEWSSKLPLGTFLSISLVASFVYGEQILGWYLNLLR